VNGDGLGLVELCELELHPAMNNTTMTVSAATRPTINRV
jgi:hypothetical protein